MSHNSFGHVFRVTSWGESHGPAIGCVVDGTPPGIPLRAEDIQTWLDKRAPGRSRFVSQRREPDRVEILSGVFAAGRARPRTTGAPIALVIANRDARPKDYRQLASRFRPGHADFTYQAKYGIRDYRGGGRASARETATRVAAGAIARKILGRMRIRGCLVQLGNLPIARRNFSWREAEQNPFHCPDKEILPQWEDLLLRMRKNRSSCGAIIEICAEPVPVGLGAPVYGKLDADLAAAMMSINAVAGVEIGLGFAAAALPGHELGDEMRAGAGPHAPRFLSQHSGGVLGGISTGQPLRVRFAVKPTSSLPRPRRTITQSGKNTVLTMTGRHDPCVGLRAVPVGEAMMACVLADHLLRHRAQTGR